MVILTVTESNELAVAIKTLPGGYKQCWVTHGLSYKFEVKRLTGEIISAIEVVPCYGGPLLIDIDCRMNRDGRTIITPDISLENQSHALVMPQCKDIIDVGWYQPSPIRLTGCSALDKKLLLPGGTRHDVLDHLRQIVKFRALHRRICVHVPQL